MIYGKLHKRSFNSLDDSFFFFRSLKRRVKMSCRKKSFQDEKVSKEDRKLKLNLKWLKHFREQVCDKSGKESNKVFQKIMKFVLKKVKTN